MLPSWVPYLFVLAFLISTAYQYKEYKAGVDKKWAWGWTIIVFIVCLVVGGWIWMTNHGYWA